MNIAADVGYKNSYTLIKDGKLSYVSADNFVFLIGNICLLIMTSWL